MAFHSMEQIVRECREEKLTFSEMILRDSAVEQDLDGKQVEERMEVMWETMKSASKSYDENLKSRSGLVGGSGGLMGKYRQEQNGFCGDFVLCVMEEAIKMGEANACMQKIVAAPTAGSCGVLPAVLLAAVECHGYTDEEVVKGLLCAAGIGQVIAERAFIAGAAGGCQAEIGAAAAMAAGALVSMQQEREFKNKIADSDRDADTRIDRDPEKISDAVAMSLKNLLGLVCDPVAGLVEIPCVKRNVAGAMIAVSSAEMALAGIKSQIPVDQVIDAMREVGEDMNEKYKETACGGCASTQRGRQIRDGL